ncbi:MAG: ABC transporter permease [Chloroflexi bacterium]|nr:ABC transporter permease [Chloroflexota bacterium]
MSSVLVALRRLREDRVPAIGLGILILVTATLFGLAPRLVDRVADDAVQGVVAGTTAFGRNISLIEEQGIQADPTDPLKNIDDEGDRLDRRLPPAIRALVSERHVVVDSARFSVRAETQDPTTIRFRIQPGAAERIRFVEGVAPATESRFVDLPEELYNLLPADEPKPDPPVKVLVIQTAVAAEGLRQSGLKVGDTVFMTVDGSDPLGGRRPGFVAAAITGVLEAIDPDDAFWHDDPALNQVTIRSTGGDSRFLDMAGYLPPESYDLLTQVSLSSGVLVRYTWRRYIDPERIAANALAPLILDLRRLEATFPRTQVEGGVAAADGVAMRSGLLPLLVAHSGRWASASAILTVVAIGPAAVACAALALVATIAARRRRPAIALVRGRGATLGQIVRAILLEGSVIAIPALAVAILLAIVLLPVGSNRATILAASAVAALAVLLLIVTALPRTLAAARAARDDDESPRGISARRLVLDAIVIVGAAVGAYLLRERGVRGTSSAGTLAGADPLIAAVPALAGIAVGLAAIRLVPLPLRALTRLARRGRGLVPLLALRRAIHGGTTGAILIVLLATASIGAFSSAALAHLDRAGAAASWQEVGAPYRVDAQIGSLPAALDPSQLPGVSASAALYRTQIPIGTRNLRIQLISVDLADYERIIAGSPADLVPPAEMLAESPAEGAVPILISAGLAERPDGAKLGKQLEIVVDGYHYQVLPITTRLAFPTLPTDAVFAIASRQQMQAIHREARLSPTTYFLDAPADPDSETAIREAVTKVVAGATVESRAVFAQAFTDSPVTAAIVAGIAIAAIVAALYAALAVTAALALAGASRATEVAHLRMIGLSRRDALGLAIVEHGPTVLFAFGAGVALGLGLFVLLQPGLGLDALVGSTLAVPMSADPRQLAIIGGGILAIATVGIGLAAWMQRRGVAVAALRRGFE